MGSKVERVKRRRVMKTKRAQMEIVDWAFDRRRLLELVRLKIVHVFDDDEEEEGDGEEDDEEEKSLLLLSTMVVPLSYGKKTRSKPIPKEVGATSRNGMSLNIDKIGNVRQLLKV